MNPYPADIGDLGRTAAQNSTVYSTGSAASEPASFVHPEWPPMTPKWTFPSLSGVPSRFADNLGPRFGGTPEPRRDSFPSNDKHRENLQIGDKLQRLPRVEMTTLASLISPRELWARKGPHAASRSAGINRPACGRGTDTCRQMCSETRLRTHPSSRDHSCLPGRDSVL
jgi:hypothetical protein